MVSPDSEARKWQECYEEQFRINETLQKNLRVLKETFEEEMDRMKKASENKNTSSLDRFCHRLFHEILSDLYTKMWFRHGRKSDGA